MLASGESMARAAFSLVVSVIAVISLLFVCTGRQHLLATAQHVFALVTSVPILLLLPLWLVLFGNTDAASTAFSVWSFFMFTGYVVFNDTHGGVRFSQWLATCFSLGRWRMLIAVAEIVLSSFQRSTFQVVLLGLPIVLAAELIANRSGLGHLAFTAYQNGSFEQLTLAAAAYLISFIFLWCGTSLALSGLQR
jgi:ABC-type nitrate/sulfonate/bicarbonate transport system permease component